MARIPNELLDEIRAKADIVDVISRYTPITKAGKNYKCLCPFHDDHNPSLTINQDKQFYHCFVCGAGGNVFTFVSKIEHIPFNEAALKVADMAGIEVTNQSRYLQTMPQDPYKDNLFQLMSVAADYFAYMLDSEEGEKAKRYLQQRDIPPNLMQKFNIGFNPSGNKMFRFLEARGFANKDMVDVGLVRISPQGLQDVFSQRITIPIHDAYGHTIAFTARRINDDDSAKYVNTAQTPLYTKGNVIFNYHRAKEPARKVGYVLIVEGAMDVLAFEKAGIENAMATLGTACTKEQMQLFKDLGLTLRVCYDGDEAGKQATYKFAMSAQEQGIDLEIVDNQTGLDPDEIIDAQGKEGLAALANKTISFIDFLFSFLLSRYDLNNYRDKLAYAETIGAQIDKVNNPNEKKRYYNLLLERTGFDLSVHQQKPSPQRKTPAIVPKRAQLVDGKRSAQKQILSQLLASKQACETYRKQLGFLSEGDCNALALYIIDFYRNEDTMDIAKLYDDIQEDACKKLLIEVSEWTLKREDYNEDALLDMIDKVKDTIWDDKIKRLRLDAKQVQDPLERAKLLDEINRLKRDKENQENEV